MSITTELDLQARELLFNEMDPVTQAAATAGKEKVKLGHKVAMLVLHDLGLMVDSVLKTTHLNEVQKSQEIKKLAAYWGQAEMGPSTLYDMRNVAVAFDREFLQAQLEERMENGRYLTWTHFKELQKLPVKAQMVKLKQVRQHCWSAKELAQELQGRQESEIRRTGGRKPTLPKTPSAMLQKIYTTVQLTDNYLMAISEPLGGLFMEMAPQEMDDKFVEHIDSTLARMAEAQQHIAETTKSLEKVRTRAQSVIQQGGKAVAAKRAPETVEAVEDVETDDEEVTELDTVEALSSMVVPTATTRRKLPRRATQTT
jgi:hypothetical protein